MKITFAFSSISIDIFIENQDTASDTDDGFMVKLIVVKERRAIAEERKANALERIAATSEKKTGL